MSLVVNGVSTEQTPSWRFEVYDDFAAPGYSLTKYAEKWFTPYGLGEMGVNDTRGFDDGRLDLSAAPFQTTSDVGISDHVKYMAVSTRTFPVPENGTIVLSSDIRASTPGTVPDLVQRGVYAPSDSWPSDVDSPRIREYSARVLQGQQAALVMNMLDFCTGQVFDWFISSDAAFALIERLPTTVTANVSNPECYDAADVGIDTMYTQIIREVPVRPDVAHHVDIALTRLDADAWSGDAWVDYFLDHQLIAHVPNVGIPLDKQWLPFTGTYPSLGSGERLADQLNSVRFGHGLFSLLDAFPFQHPEAPGLSVSIPAVSPPERDAAGRTRIYGQGASGSFDNFTTLTISGTTEPPSPPEILSALAAARSK
ncbi:MAG: hypothetical protein JWM85_2429 [Acidimicrobiaceae bacterium]|nr:hypothetical protein [Acidimicrobiaceae bacterium]